MVINRITLSNPIEKQLKDRVTLIEQSLCYELLYFFFHFILNIISGQTAQLICPGKKDTISVYSNVNILL